MDTFTISAAARLCRCDRRTLQRAIHAGRLLLDAQHCLSREDLLAAGYLVVDAPQATPQVVPHGTPEITPHGTPQDAPPPLPQEPPQTSPHRLGTYDPQAAVARIQTLRRQGLSMRTIATQLQ